MKNILYLFFALLFMACSDDAKTDDIPVTPPVNPIPPDNSDFEMLMEKVRIEFSKNPTTNANYLKLFDNTKGSFTDIDYGNTDKTNWIPIRHIDRLSDFVFAYTNSKNVYYQDESLYNKIVKGLEYWYDRNPNCDNWWSNQIDEPKKIGVLLIQMRTGKKQIPAALETKTLQRIRKEGGNPSEQTGANRTDVATHWMYRACLEKNTNDLNFALKNIFETLEYTTEEGIQHDNSFFQHGKQLYIGGYGDELLKGVTLVARYTSGSKFALSQERTEILSKFLRQTYYGTIRGQYMLFDVLGRGVSRVDATKKSSVFAKRMLEIDPANAAEYQAIIARMDGSKPVSYGIQPVHTHYFRADYTLHIRPHYTFDVRTVSTRTSRCEYGNGENLKTYFLSDGCNNIVVEGNEYANIFPCWNWARIPGVTSPQMTTIPMASNQWQVTGTSKFTGGVSDGIYGASTYSYTDTHAGINTSAKKSWFFFDNEVVCLGADISSSSSFPVQTTINQCLKPQGATIQISTNKQVQTISNKGENKYTSPDWVAHNGIGYVFPSGGTVYLNNESVTGVWYEINTTIAADKKENKEVVTIGFDHGTAPQNGTYAYIVAPNIATESAIKAYNNKQDIEILANTKEMQIVRHKTLDVWQMIFFKQAIFQHGDITVSVDKGCALMFKDVRKENAKLYVADPAQAQSRIQVKVSIPAVFQGEKSISCEFAGTGTFAGATKEYSLK